MHPGAPAAPSPQLLVLWDIDHTLIETRGLGLIFYQRAFQAATGKPLRHLAQLAGRTELDIMTETLRINGVRPTPEALTRLAHALTATYETAADELASNGRALPGARTTLAALAEDPTIYQSVLTGNLKAIARIKIETFDLAAHLDLAAGAYGDDHNNRADLVHLAQHRAKTRTDTAFPNHRTVLIGDTPNDIHAAHQAGVHAIGITTGNSTHHDLHQAGAKHILPNLTNPHQLKRTLTTLQQTPP